MHDPMLRTKLGALGKGEVLGDRVFETIRDAIVERRLAPGERVSDKEIAEALDISRTPVREALRHLSWLGVIEVSPNRFTRVTTVSDTTIADTLEYVGMQASVAVQLAVRRMDDAALDEAVALLDRMIEASDADDAPGLMLTARMFVGFATQESGNPLFVAGMHAADLLVTRNLRGANVMVGTPETRGKCYREMRAAMIRRDADAAEQWFRRHHRETITLLAE